MDIERINEDTVKFFISYNDIEERGFDKDEIWFNREKGEELFWEMMEEVHHEEDFVVEGPLWIQVQALEKGLEVFVTKAQLSKDGQRFEFQNLTEKDMALDDGIENLLDKHFQTNQTVEKEEPLKSEEDSLRSIIRFDDFEDVISLAKRLELHHTIDRLFSFEEKYYLDVLFSEELDVEEIDDLLSIALEYGAESTITHHRLEEYGKIIFERDALALLLTYFK